MFYRRMVRTQRTNKSNEDVLKEADSQKNRLLASDKDNPHCLGVHGKGQLKCVVVASWRG